MALPTVPVCVGGSNGVRVRALVDSGCSQTIISKRLVSEVFPFGGKIVSVDGSYLSCGSATVELNIDERTVKVPCLVLEKLMPEFDLVLGMDVVRMLGGFTVSSTGSSVRFGAVALGEKGVSIDDVDFSANFDGVKWNVKWKWAAGEPVLTNQIGCYAIRSDLWEDFDKEVQSWIEEEILIPVPDDEEVSSVIPLMAVEQANKGKVRPVLDFRELNDHVSCHTGGSSICEETIRRWRKIGENLALLDLRKAYLQLHVDKSLWKYQVVRYKNKCYYLTRLGFGLNCAPKIMSRILRKVLSLDGRIEKAADSYLDDILVNEDVVSASVVRQHLHKHGLESKPAAILCEGSKVLGLEVERSSEGDLIWKRGTPLPSLPDETKKLSRRELFSICGQLTAHYPVAGWLRVACAYTKRVSEGRSWDDDVGKTARLLLTELVARLHSEDPVKGKWTNKSEVGRVWCDASSLAIGCALEVDGAMVEDGAWLRKQEDGSHINMAELDSVMKGLNLAVKWGMKELEIMTDSATVFSWLRSALSETHMIKTKGLSEMLVRRRLAVVREICEEFDMRVSVTWAPSGENKADSLTRVSRKWLQQFKGNAMCAAATTMESVVSEVHKQHHFGVDRTLFLCKQRFPEVTKEMVSNVVKSCHRCCSIDPAPIRWERGELEVDSEWTRLAADITHYNGACYLSIIDCGPSRFAIWRKVSDESTESLIPEITQVFRERGPPKELVLDNARTFRSQAFRSLLETWEVTPVFRCAYRPEGNSIVERHHRTIKRMAARTTGDPLDMVFWYNVTPKEGTQEKSVPSSQLYNYAWRIPGIGVSGEPLRNSVSGGWRIGGKVFVKPPSARCTTPWPVGTITDILSSQRVEVNGIPRHVADLREVPQDISSEEDDSEIEEEREIPRQTERVMRRPDYYGNNIFDT